MNNFNFIKISDLGDIVTGRTPKTESDENYGNDYMFLGPADLHKHFIIHESEKMISQKGLDSIKSSTLDGISILVGCIGWGMGNVGIVDRKCATNQQINAITNIKKNYNPFYIYYWLKNKKEFLFQQASVTRTPILNKSNFSEIKINIPKEKCLQDKISDTLISLDRKIELNNRINTELEAMLKMLYDYWFVQFDFPDANGNPYKSTGGKMKFSSTLKRMIPNEWYDCELKDIIERSGTGLNPRDNFILGHGDNFYVTIKNIKDGKITLDEKCDKIDEKALKIIDNRSQLKVGDVLFTSIEPVGITYLINDKPENWNINESIFTLRPNIRKVTSEYLYLVLSSDEMKTFTKYSSTGSIHKGIRHSTLKSFVLPYGNKNTIDQFTDIVRPMLQRINALDKENRHLKELRDWLLPMLMNGQITVR